MSARCMGRGRHDSHMYEGRAGVDPLRSDSARQLTPEIRQSKFPGTPRPSVTLALAARPQPFLASAYRIPPAGRAKGSELAVAEAGPNSFWAGVEGSGR